MGGCKDGAKQKLVQEKYALLDLRDIIKFFSQDNPEAAGNVISTTMDTVERLGMFSEMGKPGRAEIARGS